MLLKGVNLTAIYFPMLQHNWMVNMFLCTITLHCVVMNSGTNMLKKELNEVQQKNG